jgi:hypothetical protein
MGVTNVKVQPMEVSWAGSALGLTDGDIEITLTENAVDITAHQEGTNVLSSIRTGKSAELSIAIKETHTANVRYLLKQAGAEDTPSGATGNTVVAWGNHKDFTQTLSQAGKLILHPAANASSNRAEDWAFWKAYPMPESFSFSGENPSILNVTFKIFPDTAKADQFRLFVIGDHLTGDFSATS